MRCLEWRGCDDTAALRFGHAVGDGDGRDEPEQQQLLQYERGGAGATNVGAVEATANTGINVATPALGTRAAGWRIPSCR